MEIEQVLQLIQDIKQNNINIFQQRIILLIRPYQVQIQSSQYLQLKLKLLKYQHIEIPDNLFDIVLSESENNSYLISVRTAEFSGLPFEYALNLSKLQYENYSSFVNKKNAFKIIQELKMATPQDIIPSIVLQIQPKVGHFKYTFSEVINLQKSLISKNCLPQKLNNQQYDVIQYSCQLYNQLPSQRFYVNDTSQKRYELDGIELPRLIINTYHNHSIIQSTNDLPKLLQVIQEKQQQCETALYKAIYLVIQSYYMKIQEQQQLLLKLYSSITQLQKNQSQINFIIEFNNNQLMHSYQVQFMENDNQYNIDLIINLINHQFKSLKYGTLAQRQQLEYLFDQFNKSNNYSLDKDEKYLIFCQNIYQVLICLCISGFFSDNFDENKYHKALKFLLNNEQQIFIQNNVNIFDDIQYIDQQQNIQQKIPIYNFKQFTVFKLVTLVAELFIQNDNEQMNNILNFHKQQKDQKLEQPQYMYYNNIKEDSEKGKCEICPLVYNNYNQHIQSQLHQDRYKQMLLENDLYDKLVYYQNKTEKENIFKITLESICFYLSLRILKPYKYVVQTMNKILSDCKCQIQLDPNEDINQNKILFKNEEYKIWRENILKQRMNQFESQLYKQNIQKDIDFISEGLYNACIYQQEFKNKQQLQKSLVNFQNKILDKQLTQNQLYSTMSILEEYIDQNNLYANCTQLKIQEQQKCQKQQKITEEQSIVNEFYQADAQNIYTFDKNNCIVTLNYYNVIFNYLKQQRQQQNKTTRDQNTDNEFLNTYKQTLQMYINNRKRTYQQEIILDNLLNQQLYKNIYKNPNVQSIINQYIPNLTIQTVYPKLYKFQQSKNENYVLQTNKKQLDKYIGQLQEIYKNNSKTIHQLIQFSNFQAQDSEFYQYVQNKYQYTFSQKFEPQQTQLQTNKDEQTIDYSQSHTTQDNIQYDDQARNQYYNQELHFSGQYVDLNNINKYLLNSIYHIPTVFSYTPKMLQFICLQVENIERSIMSYQGNQINFITEGQYLQECIINRNEKELYCDYVNNYQEENMINEYQQALPKGQSYYVI